MENTTIKQCIIDALLLDANRPGMEELIAYMEFIGYFEAPCSGGNHLAKEGGLAEHSWNVETVMKLVRDVLPGADAIPYESLVICSLLHDLGKCGDFGKPNYVENYIKSRKKNEAGEYEMVRSEKKPYETNKDLLYVPHEVRSVKIASKFIELTEEEEFAILYHNGLYGDFKYAIQGKETPLYLLLHFADMWASRVMEVSKDETNDADGN